MSKTVTRIYMVRNKKSGDYTLVDASHPSNALRVVASSEYEVKVPTTSEVARAYESGKKVVRITREQLDILENLPSLDMAK